MRDLGIPRWSSIKEAIVDNMSMGLYESSGV